MQFKKMLVASVLSMGLASGAQATTIIYMSGHDIDVTAAALGGVTIAAGNPTYGFSPTDANITAAIGDGSTGAYGAYDAFVVGESNGGWTAAGKASFLSYIMGGGHGVVLGAHGAEVSFLNSTFGFSVAGEAGSPSSYDHSPISRVAGSGPASLLTLNGSWFLDKTTLPETATLLYERDAGGAAAFVMNIGSGTLSWLAWDFCECAELDSDQADWFSVLGVQAIGEGIETPEPGTLALLALGVAGLGFRRRQRT